MVMMPGYQAWVHRFESPLEPEAGWPGRYINVPRCGGLSLVLLPLKDPKELFVKEREFLPSSGFLYDLSCWKGRKTPSLPSYRPHDHQGRPLHKRVGTTGVPEGPEVKFATSWTPVVLKKCRNCFQLKRKQAFAYSSMLHKLLHKDTKLCHHLRWKKILCLAFFPTCCCTIVYQVWYKDPHKIC